MSFLARHLELHFRHKDPSFLSGWFCDEKNDSLEGKFVDEGIFPVMRSAGDKTIENEYLAQDTPNSAQSSIFSNEKNVKRDKKTYGDSILSVIRYLLLRKFYLLRRYSASDSAPLIEYLELEKSDPSRIPERETVDNFKFSSHEDFGRSRKAPGTSEKLQDTERVLRHFFQVDPVKHQLAYLSIIRNDEELERYWRAAVDCWGTMSKENISFLLSRTMSCFRRVHAQKPSLYSLYKILRFVIKD